MSGSLNTFFAGIAKAGPDEAGRIASDYYCRHMFDLLGSGWTAVSYGKECRGLENNIFPPHPAVTADPDGYWLEPRVTTSNLAESGRIWRLIDPEYSPIDWQLDFKSGYRWNEKTFYRDIRFLDIRGADVKVPWELSRLQHLPQLAVQYGRSGDRKHLAEIRNQILDWIACNPPRFGVNWYSTMDVAIRVANMLVAYDLALSYGASFDDAFRKILHRSVYEHALHIVGNLEWSGDFRGNHYLSNVAGLLFAAAYLGDSVPEAHEWREFAIEEIVTAVEEQFSDDGSNFEASTSYHRLSAEMVVHCIALIQRMQKSAALPEWVLERTRLMGHFSHWATKASGCVAQVGDNDSGRFFRILPPYDLITVREALEKYSSLDGYEELEPEDHYPDERHLDHSEFLGAVSTLFGDPELRREGMSAAFLGEFVATLAGPQETRVAPARPAPLVSVVGNESINAGGAHRSEKIDLPADTVFSARAFPNFGLFILRSDRVHLFIRCGSIGQNGIGGHAHNDQLSFELTVDGETQFPDPGTYLYTPVPERRNEYRSARAHNGPRPADGEPGYLGVGLFRIVNAWNADCLSFSESGFFGVMYRRSQRIYRRITVNRSHLLIEDWAEGCVLDLSPSARIPFSPGYGIRGRA
jgi:hypothetical protein